MPCPSCWARRSLFPFSFFALPNGAGKLPINVHPAPSHTNELAEAEAIGHLRAWLDRHPGGYARLSSPHPPSLVTAGGMGVDPLADLVNAFRAAAQAHPSDADLHTVLVSSGRLRCGEAA